MNPRIPALLTQILACAFCACSPASPSIHDALETVRLEPGQAFEVDVRFCIDGASVATSESYFSVTIGLAGSGNDGPTSVAAYALGPDDTTIEDTDERDDVVVPATGEGEAHLVLDGEGDWLEETGRRCSEEQTIRIELTDGSGGIGIDAVAYMSLEYQDDLDSGDLEIEWGEPRIDD